MNTTDYPLGLSQKIWHAALFVSDVLPATQFVSLKIRSKAHFYKSFS